MPDDELYNESEQDAIAAAADAHGVAMKRERRLLPPATVRWIIRAHLKQGMTISTIARRLNVARSTVSQVLNGRSHTDITGGVHVNQTKAQLERRKDQVVQLLNQGATLAQIAAQLGISRQAVSLDVRKLRDAGRIPETAGARRRTQDAFAEDLFVELLAHCTATQATGTLDGLHIDGGRIDVRAVAQQLCERYDIRRRPA